MSITPRTAVLLLVHRLKGKVGTRTKVMKYMYFIGEMLGEHEWGFHAHFYGPYSEDVADAISRLGFLGFIDERCQQFGPDERGFERCRYDYSLTDDGRAIAEGLLPQLGPAAKQFTDAVDKVRSAAADMGYMDLSYAAKTYFLLKESGKPMLPAEIRAKAREFQWTIAAHDVEKSVSFLESLGLATRGNS